MCNGVSVHRSRATLHIERLAGGLPVLLLLLAATATALHIRTIDAKESHTDSQSKNIKSAH